MRKKPGPPRRDPLVFFMESYRVEDNGCWTWMSTVNSAGYGILNIGTRASMGAHRFSLQLATGQSGDGLQACHSCDNPICVNPEHLFWGNAHDNAMDSAAKGRKGNPFNTSKTHCPKGHPYTDARQTSGGRVCKICRSERSLKWRAENRDKFDDSMQRHRENNRDQLSANSLAYHYRHREKCLARMRAYYQARKALKQETISK